MSGHFICEYCGYDGTHADYCRELRPVEDRWLGNLTKDEMEKAAKEAREAAQRIRKDAEVDPLDLLKKYRSRFPQTHWRNMDRCPRRW